MGGQITKTGRVLFDGIASLAHERALGVPASRVRMVPSGLGNFACVMGCLALVAEERFEHPRTFALRMSGKDDQ